MTIATRLIFGVRTSETVSLTVTANGQLPELPPDLRIKTSGQDLAIPCSSHTWVTTLGAGEHVVYMPAPGDSWVDAPIAFTLGAPVMIISRRDAASAQLITWTATAGTSDPKNPWPPPLLDQVDAAPLVDPTWLSSTLATMAAEVEIVRSDLAHVPPARAAQPGRFR